MPADALQNKDCREEAAERPVAPSLAAIPTTAEDPPMILKTRIPDRGMRDCPAVPGAAAAMALRSPGARCAVALSRAKHPRCAALIKRYAHVHGIPEDLLHRVIQRESDYRADARAGPYWGLMQILPQTARTMGFRGDPRSCSIPR
jgi:soluble lytic murein transglycosylase-like protein